MRERKKAIAELRPTLPRLYQIGGSHANVIYSSKYQWLRAEQNNEALHLWKSALQRVVISPQFSVDWP